MQNCNLPTRKECFDILEEYRVPSHIIQHSLAVAKLAVFLAQRIKKKGTAIDVELVEYACLLHDVMRVCDLKESDYRKFEQNYSRWEKSKWQQLRTKYKDTPHEHAAYDILKDKYPVLAAVIRKHRYISMLDEKERPSTWEEKLVYYADKRVMHERIVSLKERLTDGHKRNVHLHGTKAQSKINTAKVDPLIYELEKEIFETTGLDVTEVTNELIDSYLKQQIKE
jgi:uncharacterized protein